MIIKIFFYIKIIKKNLSKIRRSMDQFIILLDQHIYYSPARSSKLFSTLKMTGHLEAAREFKKNYPHAKIIRQNYLANLDKYLKDTNSNEHIYLIYCGHGSPHRWNIGISKKQLEKSLKLVSNKITIISDCCYSDTMDVSIIRKKCIFCISS